MILWIKRKRPRFPWVRAPGNSHAFTGGRLPKFIVHNTAASGRSNVRGRRRVRRGVVHQIRTGKRKTTHGHRLAGANVFRVERACGIADFRRNVLTRGYSNQRRTAGIQRRARRAVVGLARGRDPTDR
jgi:hypothetical protein